MGSTPSEMRVLGSTIGEFLYGKLQDIKAEEEIKF
jgi:hypothetical protein